MSVFKLFVDLNINKNVVFPKHMNGKQIKKATVIITQTRVNSNLTNALL